MFCKSILSKYKAIILISQWRYTDGSPASRNLIGSWIEEGNSHTINFYSNYTLEKAEKELNRIIIKRHNDYLL